jgi:hypothetical protein
MPTFYEISIRNVSTIGSAVLACIYNIRPDYVQVKDPVKPKALPDL